MFNLWLETYAYANSDVSIYKMSARISCWHIFLFSCWFKSSTCLTWEMPTGKASQCMETVLSIYKYPLSLSLSPPHAYAITHTHTHAQVSSSFFPNSERMHSLFSLSPTHIRTKTHTQRRWALYTRLVIGKCIYTKHDTSIHGRRSINIWKDYDSSTIILSRSFFPTRARECILLTSLPPTHKRTNTHTQHRWAAHTRLAFQKCRFRSSPLVPNNTPTHTHTQNTTGGWGQGILSWLSPPGDVFRAQVCAGCQKVWFFKKVWFIVLYDIMGWLRLVGSLQL